MISADSDSSKLFKNFGVFFLVIQQTSMPLMVRSARDRNAKEVFITTVNVLFMDVIKLAVCAVILIVKRKSVIRFLQNCQEAIFGDPTETMKVCAPSLIYIFQNNLYYIALSNLEPTTFCVTYQFKILTTAIMLRFALNKFLSSKQWFALVLLLVGVSVVQMQYQPPRSQNNPDQSAALGFLAVLTMCITSGFAGTTPFAGVYLEKMMKRSEIDIFMQNIRLALFGVVISTVLVLLKDMERIDQDGLFVGFDPLVWTMTVTNSVGGLLISIVIKYADNIVKTYAQSIAIIGAAVGSWALFDFTPNAPFMIGTSIVIASIYIYNVYPYTKGDSLNHNKADLEETSTLLDVEQNPDLVKKTNA